MTGHPLDPLPDPKVRAGIHLVARYDADSNDGTRSVPAMPAAYIPICTWTTILYSTRS